MSPRLLIFYITIAGHQKALLSDDYTGPDCQINLTIMNLSYVIIPGLRQASVTDINHLNWQHSWLSVNQAPLHLTRYRATHQRDKRKLLQCSLWSSSTPHTILEETFQQLHCEWLYHLVHPDRLLSIWLWQAHQPSSPGDKRLQRFFQEYINLCKLMMVNVHQCMYYW